MSQDCQAPTFQDASGKLLPLLDWQAPPCLLCFLLMSNVRNTLQVPNVLPIKETSHIILKLF